jgi:hypothetical protein
MVAQATKETVTELKENGLLRSRPRTKTKAACYVYLFREEHGAVKIGVSSRWKRRLYEIGRTLPYELEAVGIIETDRARDIEQHLHKQYEGHKIKGEWFNISDSEIQAIIDKYDGEKV